jgi:hypothetical protein
MGWATFWAFFANSSGRPGCTFLDEFAILTQIGIFSLASHAFGSDMKEMQGSML